MTRSRLNVCASRARSLHNEHRVDEPYRRALIGMYARLAATLQALTGQSALRHAVVSAAAYPSAADFLDDLRVIEHSLRAHHADPLIALRLAPLIRAVEVFGFHLATVDLRQSSDPHQAVLAELLRVARLEENYGGLAEPARCALLLRLLDDARPLVRGAEYSALASGELAIFEAAASLRQVFGNHAIRQYIISHTAGRITDRRGSAGRRRGRNRSGCRRSRSA